MTEPKRKNLIAAIIVNIILLPSSIFAVWIAFLIETPEAFIIVTWLVPSSLWLIFEVICYQEMRRHGNELTKAKKGE